VIVVVGWYAPSSVSGGKQFQAISPRRILDTHLGIGEPTGKVLRNGTVVVKVAGKGRVLPKSAKAVLLNLTSSSGKLAAYRTSWPSGLSWPAGSDITLTKGTNTSNLVIVRVRHKGKKKGKINLRNYAKKTHLVADIVGYYR
jgi:hypothetical protein